MVHKTGQELRKMFIDFWVSKGSRHYPSFSLVPEDPTLLFTIAGMVPFKKYYLGMKPEYPRAVTSQKCIRTNDIDNVGRTARHHTFFEMLGNFAWGNYFKREAITWSWEFLTEYAGLDRDRLYATIYLDDEEAFDIWHKEVGLSKDRIYRFGEDENYWFMGNTGPCGPCSEIMYDQGPSFSCGKPTCDVGCDCDRYLEVWNLVFTQFDRQEDGSLISLPKKNIDTGMGLERLTALVQGVKTDFETDLFSPLIEHTCSMAGIKYGEKPKQDMAVKVIADHSRALAFMIADGILPSNEGQGYVLRRLLRRAVRYGRLIGLDKPFLCDILPVVIELMGDPYSEIIDQRPTIEHVISLEEEKFDRTLEQGTNLLDREIQKLMGKEERILSGKIAFELYDTYGFPFELTEEICNEQSIEVDSDEFDSEMTKQKERARASSKHVHSEVKADVFSRLQDKIGDIDFLGYDKVTSDTVVKAVIRDGEEVDILKAGQEGDVVLDSSPFYAERGGQVGDTGTLTGDDVEAAVDDTFYAFEDLIVHKVRVISGKLEVGKRIFAKVDEGRRLDIKRNHTATHLLHEALQSVLGMHARQSGSMVSPEFLRFDFTHFESLSRSQINEIENIVNEKILDDIPVDTTETTMSEARKAGAKALFEEKYGEKVRVVNISGYSVELCGGTHIGSTGQIGPFKILREESVGSGVRRVTAVTGHKSLSLLHSLYDVTSGLSRELSVESGEIPGKVKEIINELKSSQKEIEDLKLKLISTTFEEKLNKVEIPKGISVLTASYDKVSPDLLRELGDKVKNKNSGSVLVLSTVQGPDSVQLIAMADDKALENGVHCGRLIKQVASSIGGGGGGRPAMAQAGGKDAANLEKALQQVADIVKEQLN